MSKLMYELANVYVEEGRLSKRSLDDYEIFCYTKEEFFNKTDWDEVTKSHRGKIYRNGFAINHPFPKIFNLDEVEECSTENVLWLIENVDFDIYDKSNGHLLIASYTPNGDLVLSTKGSIVPSDENMLLKNDIELYEKRIGDRFKPFGYTTLMFEVIADYDKHTLYETEKEILEAEGFVGNQLVLLGAYQSIDAINWVPTKYGTLKQIGIEMDIPVIDNREDVKETLLLSGGFFLEEMKTHKNTEGYVIHFPSIDFRVKIKTSDYWALRLKKDLTTEKILDMFKAGGVDRLRTKLPEEISDEVINIICDEYSSWYMKKMSNIPTKVFGWSDKEIFTCDSLTKFEKIHAKDVKQGKFYEQILERIVKTEELRAGFVLTMEHSDVERINKTIVEIVTEM